MAIDIDNDLDAWQTSWQRTRIARVRRAFLAHSDRCIFLASRPCTSTCSGSSKAEEKLNLGSVFGAAAEAMTLQFFADLSRASIFSPARKQQRFQCVQVIRKLTAPVVIGPQWGARFVWRIHAFPIQPPRTKPRIARLTDASRRPTPRSIELATLKPLGDRVGAGIVSARVTMQASILDGQLGKMQSNSNTGCERQPRRRTLRTEG